MGIGSNLHGDGLRMRAFSPLWTLGDKRRFVLASTWSSCPRDKPWVQAGLSQGGDQEEEAQALGPGPTPSSLGGHRLPATLFGKGPPALTPGNASVL